MTTTIESKTYSVNTAGSVLAAMVAAGRMSRNNQHIWCEHERKWVIFSHVRPVWEKTYQYTVNWYSEEVSYHNAGLLLAQM